MRAKSTAAISVLAIGLIPVSARADEHVLAGGGLEALATADKEMFASADEARRCTFVKAAIVTDVVPCDGFLMCTAGTIDSGLLAGTTFFRLLTVAPAPSDDDADEPPGALLYSGELIISAAGGDLKIRDRGVLKGTRFFEIDRIRGGTGDFENASGALVSYGTTTATHFDGTIAGRVCLSPEAESEED
jgi:hypothetical protein